MGATESFRHSTPELYERLMVPLLFEPFAAHLASRVRELRPSRILETAAGTGVATRAIAAALPEATIVATDVNPAMLEVAGRSLDSERVTIEPANALELRYEAGTFDLVLSQFGVMFFPDKVQSAREARRVLTQEGRYLLVTFDDLASNPVPRAADEAVAALFPDDPPRYMERGPFSYADPAVIDRDLRAAGFGDVAIETISLSTRVDALSAAQGMVLGSPFRAEIERRDPSSLERATEAVTDALRPWDGKTAPMSAHLVTASA